MTGKTLNVPAKLWRVLLPQNSEFPRDNYRCEVLRKTSRTKLDRCNCISCSYSCGYDRCSMHECVCREIYDRNKVASMFYKSR